MFLTQRMFERRTQELERRRYFGMAEISEFTAFDDTEDSDTVHSSIPSALYSSEKVMKNGDVFEGRDKYLWLYKKVRLPEKKENCQTVGIFDFGKTGGGNTSGFESLLYVNGKPYQGVDTNHGDVVFDDFSGQETELVFMLWSGLEGGGEPRNLTHKFSRASVGYLHNAANKLYYYAKAITETLPLLDNNDTNKLKLTDILETALQLINWDEDKFYGTVTEALEVLQKKIKEYGKHSDVTVNCIGHTHIDMAWLWRLKHSREKGQRSFSTVNRLMDEYDEYKFLQTQPQLYAYIKEDAPEIYDMIKRRVSEGKWEPDGGMWLEADCNIPSGESLVRQLTYGINFMQREFGKKCEYLWLPDVFGYSWSLPQILLQCGIKTFMTTKISWNQLNSIPNDLFYWKGIDGSRILTYFITTPAKNNSFNKRFTTYNGLITPHSVIGSFVKFKNKDITNETLIAYGYGDGGGGVSREMLELRRVMDELPGLPNVKTSFASDFFDKMHEAADAKEDKVSEWDGELYLEYHRGTYTTQAANKRNNRKNEIKLFETEWLATLSSALGGKYPSEAIDDCWEKLLCLQFHDIIPGSSIREVYADSDKTYAEIGDKLKKTEEETVKPFVTESADYYTAFTACPFKGTHHIFVERQDDGVFTTPDGAALPSQRCDGGYTVKLETKPFSVTGFCFKSGRGESKASPFSIEGESIETPYYSIEFSENGSIKSIFDKENSREVLKGEGNKFEIFEDKPVDHDAWDIDAFYTDKCETPEFLGRKITENGELMLTVRSEYKYNKSVITQDMVLYSSSRRIDFKTKVDWHENHRLLKTAFGVDVRSTKATYDIQFGHAERPTHSNTSWDYAKFEVVAHKWMDISDSSYGVSLLNDCKYGHSAKGNVIKLTLLKSPKFPDYAADMGEHMFTYSLLPHTGNAVEGDTIEQANLLNIPPLVIKGKSSEENKQLFKIDSENVSMDAVKACGNGDGVLIRLHECRGGKANVSITSDYGIKAYAPSDLLENPIGDNVNSDTIETHFDPFEIKSFIVKL